MRREQAVARGEVRGLGVLIHLQISFSDRRQLLVSATNRTEGAGVPSPSSCSSLIVPYRLLISTNKTLGMYHHQHLCTIDTYVGIPDCSTYVIVDWEARRKQLHTKSGRVRRIDSENTGEIYRARETGSRA